MASFKKLVNSWYARSRVIVQPTPLSVYVDLLNANAPFSFSRYGDGEWAAILSRKGRNCDGHEYFPQLGERLRNALLRPKPYRYGMQNNALRRSGIAICRFLRRHRIKLDWHNSDVFHYANRDGRLFPLIRALRQKPVVMIGPAYLKKLDTILFPFASFVEVPQKNCFLEADSIAAALRKYGHRHAGVVYAFSASMTTNVLIDELYPLLGSSNWMIDFGSIWDIYAGVRSRSVYAKIDWDSTITRNLHGEEARRSA
jgi:hypothetical protein